MKPNNNYLRDEVRTYFTADQLNDQDLGNSGTKHSGGEAAESPRPALAAFVNPKCPDCDAPYSMREGSNGIVESSCHCGCRSESEYLFNRYMKATGKKKATDLRGMRLRTPFGEVVCGSLHPFGISVSDSGFFPFVAFSWTFTRDWEWDTAYSSCAHSDWCDRWVAETKHERYYDASRSCSCGATAYVAA